MAGNWRTVRVFISSTFRDMQAERDHLVRFVFPRLREELLLRRIHLVDVDLRWGVTSDQDAIEVCREIIDECRPRFLCMLGGRYGWTPPGHEHSITAEEVRYGVLDRLGRHGYAMFYFRDPAATDAMVEPNPGDFREPPGSPNEGKFVALKDAITTSGLHPFVYPAAWDKTERRLTGLEVFGNRVYADLMSSIDDEFGKEPPEKLDEFAEENAAMEAFIEERTERYVVGSRQSVFDRLLQHAEGTGGNGYLCLTGEPGSGKSALLGKFYRDYSRTHPDDLVIPHFVGASPGSTDVRRTLRRLCHELIAGTGLTAEIPEDPDKLRAAFPDILGQACAKRRIVLLIDAINQFDAASQSSTMAWMPAQLPENARIILSTLPSPALDDLRRRPSPPEEVPLPALSPDDADTIVMAFLKRYRKSMSADQLAALLAKDDAGTPLYLLAALEELRTLGAYEEITDRIRELPGRTSDLFAWILKRLEADPGFRGADGRLVGADLVSRFGAYLGASRHGLSQQELVELFDAGDPRGNVAALLQLLSPYLMLRGELLDFYHGQFRSATDQTYLSNDAKRLAAHSTLASYFRSKVDPSDDGSWAGDYTRGWSELAFHIFQAGCTVELDKMLMTFLWIRGRLRATDVLSLIGDYDLLKPERNEALGLVQGAVQLSAQVLSHDISQLPAHLTARLLDIENPQVEHLLRQIRRDELTPWLQPLTHSLTAPGGPLLRTLEGHIGAVMAVAVTPDGRLAVSGSGDTTLKVWDLETGACLRTLRGHGRDVSAVAVTPDGKRVISGSEDFTLKIWDLDTGICVRTLEGKNPVAVTPDGRTAVSAFFWKALKVWKLDSGMCLRTLAGHYDEVHCVATTPDGRLAVSGSKDGELKVWDIESGSCRRTLTGHVFGTRCVAVTPDGRYVISGGGWDDGHLKVWDLETGACLRKGYTIGGFFSVAVTPDGRRAVLACGNDTLKLWDMHAGKWIKTLRGPGPTVWAVAVTPDGRRAICGSGDGTLTVWDLEGSSKWATLEAHRHGVGAVGMTLDGRRAVTWGIGKDREVKVWDVTSGTCLQVLKRRGNSFAVVAATPDGQWAMLVSWRNAMKLWDLERGTCLRTLKGHRYPVDRIAVTPDGTRAISASIGGTLKLWDLKAGTCLRTLEGLQSEVEALAATAHGRQAICGLKAKTLQIWDLETGVCLQTMLGHRGSVRSVAVTPDGQRVISVSEDRTLKVWDTNSGVCLRTLEEHGGSAYIAGVAPDSQWAFSVSNDKNLRVWNIENGEPMASFAGEASMRSCAVGPDGMTLVAGDSFGRVHFLRLVPPQDASARTS